MAAQTPNELLQWLADNQFLPLPQVEEIRALLPKLPTPHALIKDMVGRSWLRPFQANQILAGKQAMLVIGPYRLLERLGEGAMGQVFKAWNVCLGRFAAVKMLHANHTTNSKAMDRFRQEMAATGHLKHPNIVEVRDAGEIDDRPYLVMDYCEGTNLSQLVKAQGPLPIHLACDYIRQAALGVQHANDRGVVHRDIKPSNLMLTTAGPEGPGVVKILDFGLARLQTNPAPNRLTQIGNIIGTIDYVAPEQVENAQKADIRSDIYSLGGTLFYLLVGRPPFTGNTIVEKMSGRLVGQIPQLKQDRPDVPAELDALLARMMAKRPAERFQTATELAQALAPFCTAVGVAVPMARPVAASSRQLAQPAIPVATAPPPEAPPWEQPLADHQENANPFTFADTPVVGTAEGTLVATPASAPEVLTAVALDLPSTGISSGSIRHLPGGRKIWMIAGGGALGLVVMLVLIVSLWPKGQSAGKNRDKSIVLSASPLSITLIPGQAKSLKVSVERKGFDGPVELWLTNLPEGVTAKNAVVKTGEQSAEVRVRASYSIPNATANAQLQASAGNLEAEPVSVTVAVRK